MTPTEFARRIDLALLGPAATRADVERAAAEAVKRSFAALCVAPVWANVAAKLLNGSGVLATVVVSYPFGGSKPLVKAIEASSAVKDGADGVEVVAHMPNLIRADHDAAKAELLDVVRAVRAARRDAAVAVVIESALLLSLGSDRGEEAIDAACRAVRESGCDEVTTDTGWHSAGGATPEAVRLIRRHSDGLRLKAAGGVTAAKQAAELIAAGADRVGTSGDLLLPSAP